MRYDQQSATFLDVAIRCADLTLPYLMKQENDYHTPFHEDTRGNQSVPKEL